MPQLQEALSIERLALRRKIRVSTLNAERSMLNADLHVLLVSRGEVAENREKAKRHGLTFPIVLQKKWEISKLYAMFATPVAYLINEHGLIAAPVVTGAEAILALASRAMAPAEEKAPQPALAGAAAAELAGAAGRNGGTEPRGL
jgi:hypothetical protein